MRHKWRGKEFKELLWKAGRATTVQYLNLAMEELKQLNRDAFEWVASIPPIRWTKSHFTGRAHCDSLLNDMCESLNYKPVKGRDKPIITCLEFIQDYIMKKIILVQRETEKAQGPLTHTATKILENLKTEAADCRVTFCGAGKFQLIGHDMEQYVVDMQHRTCSCKRWEVTWIPYKHSMACIWDMRQNNLDVRIPESYVHPTYLLSTWKEMCGFTISPINERSIWPKSPCPTTLLPPNHRTPIGRPKKKRMRSATEEESRKRVKSMSNSVTCSKCNQIGHNARSYKGQFVWGQSKEAAGSSNRVVQVQATEG